MENKSTSFVFLGSLLGGSIIIASLVFAVTFYKVRSFDESLSVTGSAKQSVRADQVKWNAQFSRLIPVSQLKSGYVEMAKDLELVKKFYIAQGFVLTDLIISPVMMEEVYDYNQNGVEREKRYTLRQTIELTSSDVEKVGVLARSTQSLIEQGVLFFASPLEYYYTELPKLRVSLLSKAVEDAQARAAKLVESTGRKVGVLKSAASGVVRVLPAHSVEVSDYGAYDTASLDKEVMVTVRASFTIR